MRNLSVMIATTVLFAACASDETSEAPPRDSGSDWSVFGGGTSGSGGSSGGGAADGSGGTVGSSGGSGGGGGSAGSGGSAGATCNPAFCPNTGMGTPCCSNHQCAMDMGMGCFDNFDY